MIDLHVLVNMVERLNRNADYRIEIFDLDGNAIVGRKTDVASILQACPVNEKVPAEIEVDNHKMYMMNAYLYCSTERMGLLSITGGSREIVSYLQMTKVFLENYLEEAYIRLMDSQRISNKKHFLERLMLGDPTDRTVLMDFFEYFKYDPKLIRIPILITTTEIERLEEIRLAYIATPLHGFQEISWIVQGKFVNFKVLPRQDEQIFSTYKQDVLEYIHQLDGAFEKAGIKCRYFVGTFQNDPKQYHTGYQHAAWLSRNIKSEEDVLFFYDYIDEYFLSKIDSSDLANIFMVHGELMGSQSKKDIVSMFSVLEKNNFNFGKSSQAMFLHKNTLYNRYNRIRETLDVDPVNETKDRRAMWYFTEYLNRIIGNLFHK